MESIFGYFRKKREDQERKIWHFNSDDAHKYFENKRKVVTKSGRFILDYIQSTFESNGPINYLDLGGKAKFIDPRIAHSFSFSLDRVNTADTNRHFYGDFLDPLDFAWMIKFLAKEKLKIHFSTLETIGGLDDYAPFSVANVTKIKEGDVKKFFFKIIFRRLRQLRSVYEDGGLILLGKNSYLNNFIFNGKFRYPELLARAGFELVEEASDNRNKVLRAISLRKNREF